MAPGGGFANHSFFGVHSNLLSDRYMDNYYTDVWITTQHRMLKYKHIIWITTEHRMLKYKHK